MEWFGVGGPRLIGREMELQGLQAHLRAAGQGDGRLLLLEGPAGIGKSTLLTALRPMAIATGARWLSARGSEHERDFPFGVVRQLLEPALADEAEGLLDGAAALAATVLGTPKQGPDAAEPGFAVLHGLFWLVANLAERHPLVLCVDDLQWADAPSLRFLDHLAIRLEGLPVLGALAARAGDAALTIGPIARLAAHPDVFPIPVEPLDAGAVAAIVRGRLGEEAPADLVAACHHVTRGNPFLLHEVLGELRRSGQGSAADPAGVRALAPPAIVRALRLRLEALRPHTVGLVRAIAVLGDGCDLRAAAELARLRPEVAQDAVEELVRADVLAAERPLRFTHAVVLSAARETMSAAVRSDLHRRAAAMAARDPGGLDAAAGHLLAVDPVGDHAAASVLRDAAVLARRRGAADTASTYLRRALAEPPAADDLPGLLAELAGAAGFAGEPDALVFAERAIELGGSPTVSAAAAREAALLHALAGRHEAAAEVMARMLASANLPAVERLMGEGMLLVSAALAAGARRRHYERLRTAREVAEQLGDDAPAALLTLLAFEQVIVGGDCAAGLALLDRALAGGRLLREVTADSPFPFIAGNALIASSRYPVADRTLTDTIADAAARGSIRAYALATGLRGLARMRCGRLADAEADARASLEIRDGRSVVQFALASSALAGVLVEGAGDTEAAAEVMATIPGAARDPDSHLGAVVEDVRARVHTARREWDDVLMACAASAEWERRFGVQQGGWTGWRAIAAEAHAAVGDEAQAQALATEGVALARRFGAARTLGICLGGAGRVAPDPEERVRLLSEAATVLVAGGVRSEAARTLADLGEALAGLGRRDDARATLQQALVTAEAAGARPTEQRARDGLVALGARPRRRTASGLLALTAGERRVAELAAQGASNREIAEQLFLTLKTVENHLTSTYRKLGISSRAQLADRLR